MKRFALVGMVLLASTQALALTSALNPGSAAPLPDQTTRLHPAISASGTAGKYNLYSGNLSVAGFSMIDSMTNPFASITGGAGELTGSITSEVWRYNADGHLLFTYQFEVNESSAHVLRTANMGGVNAAAGIIDSGLLTDEGFTPGQDLVQMHRNYGGTNVAYHWFIGNTVTPPGHSVQPGTIATPIYLETDSTLYTRGGATVQNSNASDDDVEVFVPGIPGLEQPIPEPMTMVTLGAAVAAAGGYIRRRRMA